MAESVHAGSNNFIDHVLIILQAKVYRDVGVIADRIESRFARSLRLRGSVIVGITESRPDLAGTGCAIVGRLVRALKELRVAATNDLAAGVGPRISWARAGQDLSGIA